MNAPGPHRAGGPGVDLAVRRGILLVTAAAALTAALAGLARLGIALGWGPAQAAEHGPLFVLGVFGTVISLERAVALARPWAFAAPALGAAAAVAMLAGWSPGAWAAAGSGVALVAVNAAIVRLQAAPFTWLMLAGSAVLALGSIGWALGLPVFQAVWAWIAFFVLTIAAERLELSRLAPTPPRATRVFVVLGILLAVLALARLAGWTPASRGLGVVMALVAVWQLRHDLARRTVRQRGLPRFAAAGVLLGAGWLLVTGVLLAAVDPPPAGPTYDAALHGVLVGYVLSMVFAHAPIILPAVARTDVPFTPALYAPLALLHLGLVARIWGDLAAIATLRQAGGIANAISLALLPAVVVATRLRRRYTASRSRQSRARAMSSSRSSTMG